MERMSWIRSILIVMDKRAFQQKILASDKPILIDFWAEWCGPCQRTTPVLEEIALEFAGKVEFLQVDADSSRQLLEQFRVLGIPTVIALSNGKEVGRVTGAQTEGFYRAMFESLSEGREIHVSLFTIDRMLRLGAGALFVIVGIVTSNWYVAAVGVTIAFLGLHDSCPILSQLKRILKDG